MAIGIDKLFTFFTLCELIIKLIPYSLSTLEWKMKGNSVSKLRSCLSQTTIIYGGIRVSTLLFIKKQTAKNI